MSRRSHRLSSSPMTEYRIGLTLAESTSPPVPRPYDPDAPNVLVIVLDDLGFAQLGCYGSDIDTPNLDRLAGRGLRFTNFHTTAVCSPTRACLLTGRNHHRVGVGMLTDMPINFPGYNGQIPDSAGTLAQYLGAEGWATFAVGKWHLTPPRPASRRAVSHLAHRGGIRPLLRIPQRRDQPVDPPAHPRPDLHRTPGHSRGGISPRCRSGRPGHRLPAGSSVGRPQSAVHDVVRHRHPARPPSGAPGVDRPLRRAVRPGLGRVARRSAGPPEGDGGHPTRCGVVGAARMGRALGRHRPPTASGCMPA